ncbi:MAG: hydroxyisourate hydrolase [Alphaproteobacteria bacterium]
MGRLTTHILDTARGCPAAGVNLSLERVVDNALIALGSFATNADGRVDRPLLEGEAMQVGDYEILFRVGDYFAANRVPRPNGPFLDLVPVRFRIADADAHYHVPLLLSPYGYSTYRGS